MSEIIVALDLADRKELEETLEKIRSYITWVKIGMEMFYAFGPEIITYIKNKGFKIFLDLKLHDIPNTVEKAAAVLSRYGVNIFNLHTLGGYDMMKRTADKVRNISSKEGLSTPLIIGVTILTSINESVMKNELKISSTVVDQVLHLAELGRKAGLDGVVASALECKKIKQVCGQEFLTVIPGIRPSWAQKGDQARILTPKKAVEDGADYLVVGRPILEAPDPIEAIKLIKKEISEAE